MTDNVRVLRFEDDDWRNLLLTELKRTGGDPSVLFEILEGIIEQRAWETLLDEEGKPLGTLRRFIEAPPPVGCGQKVEKVLHLLEVEHRYEEDNKQWHTRMINLRRNIRQELGIEVSQTYRLARLRKDTPDIAERVLDGEISVEDGMQELRALQEQPEYLRRAVNMVNAKSAVKTLTQCMQPDVIDELIDLLIEYREG